MVTAESVKAKLQGLISLANNTTGKTETDLTAAVNALIAGFGQGGSSAGTSGIYMAKITPASDVGTMRINHNLGTTDILFAACFVETLGGTVPTFACALGKWWAKTDIPNNRSTVGYNTLSSYNVANAYAICNAPTSGAYWDEVENENSFVFRHAGSGSNKYMAGVTYTVIIMAASAFSVTEV